MLLAPHSHTTIIFLRGLGKPTGVGSAADRNGARTTHAAASGMVWSPAQCVPTPLGRRPPAPPAAQTMRRACAFEPPPAGTEMSVDAHRHTDTLGTRQAQNPRGRAAALGSAGPGPSIPTSSCAAHGTPQSCAGRLRWSRSGPGGARNRGAEATRRRGTASVVRVISLLVRSEAWPGVSAKLKPADKGSVWPVRSDSEHHSPAAYGPEPRGSVRVSNLNIVTTTLHQSRPP
jgi:hypothetical protein